MRTKCRFQLFIKLFRIDGFGHIAVKSVFHDSFLVRSECVCRYGNNGHSRGFLTNLSRCFITVHSGQIDVHDDKLQVMYVEQLHSFYAVPRMYQFIVRAEN